MEKKDIKAGFKTVFNKDAGFEANALSIIIIMWLSPILLAYFILKFGIVNPIKSLFGGRKK
tara:strand:- start:81 stop:263 length:183 start_codon:yes stop_codon:yes gene_type:complete